MKIEVKQISPQDVEDEIAAVGLFEDEGVLSGTVEILDRRLESYITGMIAKKKFSGKLNEIHIFPTLGRLRASHLCVGGLGKRSEFDTERIRDASGRIAVAVREAEFKSFSTFIHGDSEIDLGEASQAVVEGTMLALYQFNKYKTEDLDKIKNIEKMTIVESDGGKIKIIKEGVEKAKIISNAVYLARDLVTYPSCDKTPQEIAEVAKRTARENKLSCEILDAKKLKKLGFGAMLGVALGSSQPCNFIIIEYNRRKNYDTIVIVGKGITFDSGGISIKSAEGMEKMKYDMAGAAAVIGAIQAASQLKIPLHIVALVPLTENMPSGNALKPGDILKSHSGKTIEIISTDAEGRLILADALSFAKGYKPKAVIDLATLTGACVIALGNQAMGLYSTDDELKKRMEKAAEKTRERVWHMPLWKEYFKQIESDVADVKNTGGRAAGSITGAAFLSKFIENVPWIHLDIAGMAWTEKDKSSLQQNYIPKGATGIGVRLLVQFLRDWQIH